MLMLTPLTCYTYTTSVLSLTGVNMSECQNVKYQANNLNYSDFKTQNSNKSFIENSPDDTLTQGS